VGLIAVTSKASRKVKYNTGGQNSVIAIQDWGKISYASKASKNKPCTACSERHHKAAGRITSTVECVAAVTMRP
jgi:hypothetical protein